MSPHSTRERILDSAESLFAERGLEATTLRALTRHAGVNLAAVHYHFGSKEKLLDAVVERLAAPVNDERGEALRALEDDGERAPEAAAILCAYFEPVIERMVTEADSERAATIARLLARIEAQPRDEVARLAERHFGGIARRYVDALARALPRLDRTVVIERFRLASAVLTALFADSPALGDVGSRGDEPVLRDAAARAREALTFAVAGLCAPPSPLPRETRTPSAPLAGSNGRRLEVTPR